MRRFSSQLALWLIRRADEKTKREILKEAVKDLFCAISADDILKENPDGTMNFEGKLIDASFRKELRGQAETLERMFLWKILRKDIEYALRRKMFEEACGQAGVRSQMEKYYRKA